MNQLNLIRISVAIVVTSFIEAKTDQIDNTILPLIMYIMLVWKFLQFEWDVEYIYLKKFIEKCWVQEWTMGNTVSNEPFFRNSLIQSDNLLLQFVIITNMCNWQSRQFKKFHCRCLKITSSSNVPYTDIGVFLNLIKFVEDWNFLRNHFFGRKTCFKFYKPIVWKFSLKRSKLANILD